jgi:hypothetical protein
VCVSMSTELNEEASHLRNRKFRCWRKKFTANPLQHHRSVWKHTAWQASYVFQYLSKESMKVFITHLRCDMVWSLEHFRIILFAEKPLTYEGLKEASNTSEHLSAVTDLRAMNYGLRTLESVLQYTAKEFLYSK